MTAPAPTPAEAAIIDRFGIFDEERVVEYRRLAAAAVAAYRATQDGGAEEAVRRVASQPPC
jgi:hypothetical protein